MANEITLGNYKMVYQWNKTNFISPIGPVKGRLVLLYLYRLLLHYKFCLLHCKQIHSMICKKIQMSTRNSFLLITYDIYIPTISAVNKLQPVFMFVTTISLYLWTKVWIGHCQKKSYLESWNVPFILCNTTKLTWSPKSMFQLQDSIWPQSARSHPWHGSCVRLWGSWL